MFSSTAMKSTCQEKRKSKPNHQAFRCSVYCIATYGRLLSFSLFHSLSLSLSPISLSFILSLSLSLSLSLLLSFSQSCSCLDLLLLSICCLAEPVLFSVCADPINGVPQRAAEREREEKRKGEGRGRRREKRERK